ncbi:MAG: hypothetical protein NTV07_00505, partial [Candidatus Omnitrophica bacterium]|nr:hypothetical protein [Candidatus Omnitrophota bacterium]
KLTLNGDVKLYLDSTATALNITSNGQLVILGTVTIYSDGDLNISGNGVANKSSLPANCVIYCTDDVHNVSFSGNGNLCGAIYAPDAAITVSGNGDVYGSLVGNSFTDTGNGTIHYDEALKNTGLGSQYKVTSWKEDHG